jgi:hypothetical protein
MSPEQAYRKIFAAILMRKKDRWSNRLYKKYTKKKCIRVPDYEIYLNEDPYYAFEYCRTMLKGKLPPAMHNKMICLHLMNDDIAKKYFEYLKNIKSDSPSLL